MDYWQEEIKHRLEVFQRNKNKGGIAVSIKIRFKSGCFCRDHCCPAAHRIIDDYRSCHQIDQQQCEYIEHESGPELLLYLGLGVAGLGLARESLSIIKSAIELVTVIVKARSEGQKQGDKRDEPLIILVRGFSQDGIYFENQALEANPKKVPNKKDIENSLTAAIQLIAEEISRQVR